MEFWFQLILQQVFDFSLVRSLILRPDFSPSVGLHFKRSASEDFGHGHPDPNLTYAKELVDSCMEKTDLILALQVMVRVSVLPLQNIFSED
ncbi:hypothetical protein SASPL_110705 [Salvia splendens]|uniref:Uncharacterized protein n=1 Tax=Salvia splendens TaxID=180675 RepID=A0A8X9A1Q5_SALSN|nr:hypothetical protein SASPL_110705 [Salvia splendens]